MKYKLRYHRTHTVKLMSECKSRQLETWAMMPTLTGIANAALKLFYLQAVEFHLIVNRPLRHIDASRRKGG